jgi:hypothetical protein
MKVPKFILFLLSLSLAILTSSAACMLLKPEKPMILTGNPENEFLGIPWGCSFEELQKILDESPFPTKFMKVDVHGDYTTYEYRGNNNLPYAKYSHFSFWKGKLNIIAVFFTNDTSHLARAHFDDLKKQMKKELEKINGVTIENNYGVAEWFWGKKGDMSFKLEYGRLAGLSDTTVVLSANK